jgi:hypothetical protein
MNNQIILWSMIILPVFTLLFIKKDDIKRYTPVALLTAVTGSIIVESGTTLELWAVKETLFPLNQIPPYIYTSIPIFTMWIFKFTYGRLWLYVVTNAVVDIGFAYVILPWLVRIGIFEFISSPLLVYLINITHEFLLYYYQIWQDDIFVLSRHRNSFMSQPLLAKPLYENESSKDKE